MIGDNAINNLNGTTYYLDQNLDNLKTEIKFDKRMHIQFSNDFPNQEYENFFNIYYDNFKEKNHEQTYDEQLQDIKQKYPNFCTDINCLKILSTVVDIDHICTKCDIQLTSKSQLNSQYSIFMAHETCEQYSILISNESKAIFKNCHFLNCQKIFLFIDDFSTVIFDHCIFENNHISCLSLSGSKATFTACKFRNEKHVSAFSRLSYNEFLNCEFFNHEGKAIYGRQSAEIYVKSCRFINIKKGMSTVDEQSILVLDGQVSIENCNNSALVAFNNSEIKGHDLIIKNIEGNAINLDNSSGCFINVKIYGAVHPTLSSCGNNSNPIFQNCELYDNRDTFCVICKKGSRPLFDHCKFSECETNCFSLSDFSHPHIQNCYFENISRFYVNVCGGSFLTYDNIESSDKSINVESKINLLKSAKCERRSLNDDDFEPIEVCANEYKWICIPEIFKSLNHKHLNRMSVFDMIKETENKESLLKCCKCHKEMCENDGAGLINPCGHLICKDCIGMTRCPLCDSPVKNFQKLFLENQCALCLDKKPNTISLPCGHVCMCFECAMENVSKGFNCPMCNGHAIFYKFNFDDIK